jgi:hypothetical protein
MAWVFFEFLRQAGYLEAVNQYLPFRLTFNVVGLFKAEIGEGSCGEGALVLSGVTFGKAAGIVVPSAELLSDFR